ncbi:MAG: hypothetical protein GXY74_10355 [Phycisphaerae bacterium]|nr:hypothetical protein [Phycisphaerae bacterium]
MDVSGISASMAKLMGTIAKTDTEGVADRVIHRNDADGDGALTIGELGVDQDEFAATDTDGDGVVSRSELVARIASRLNELTNLVLGETDSGVGDLSQIKNLFEMLSSQSQDKTGYDTIVDLLTSLGVSTEDTEKLVALLEQNGLDVTV